MFMDQARIVIRSGKGGDGHISFRREKYVPNGGPDGGDGGDGGSVYFEVDPGLNTLNPFRYKRHFFAQDGENGKKKKSAGKKGEDIVIKVPEGTIVRESEGGRIIADLSGETRRVCVLRGGKGGIGNRHFATSRMQAPKYAKPGQPSMELTVDLELKMIAEVGLVGFPNAGKSTLLSAISAARPKIGDYPFTTLFPNLGLVDMGDGRGFICADIPGLIEGASEGAGLGHRFLRHIERTRILLFLVDASEGEGRSATDDLRILQKELSTYREDLLQRPYFILANKMDLLDEEEREEKLKELASAFPEAKIYPISAATGEGCREMLQEVYKTLRSLPDEVVCFEPEFDSLNEMIPDKEDSYTLKRTGSHEFRLEGPAILKMLGFTNLESEKGFLFFQKFLRERGIISELEKLGAMEKDTIHVYGHQFEYYSDDAEPVSPEEEEE